MFEVKEKNISNIKLRKSFFDFPDILDIITKRQLNWLQKVTLMDPATRLPRQLIASWTIHSRNIGQPQKSYRNSYAEALSVIIPDIHPQAPLHIWIPLAIDEPKWKSLVNKWWKSPKNVIETDPTNTQESELHTNPAHININHNPVPLIC